MTGKKPRLTDWEHLPDIELYLDQVLSILSRQQLPDQSEAEMTASMINNYVKAGLLPRTTSKRYGREHLSRLIIISALKSVLSVTELKQFFDSTDLAPRELYEQFCGEMEREAQNLETPERGENAFEAVLSGAVKAALYKQRAQMLLSGAGKEDA